MAGRSAEVPERDPSYEAELEAWFNFKINVLSNRISRVVARSYAESYGIGVIDWRTLVAIEHFGPTTASAISERTQLDKGSLSRAIARLSKKGWIERSAGSRDRRQTLLRITGAGKTEYRAIAPQALERQRALLSALSEREREDLAGLIDRLLLQADSMLAEPAD